MHRISVFDMLKIGIGPSSSHTLGPWRAAQRFLQALDSTNMMSQICRLQVELFGSLALTGKGHGTDIAILLGLSGTDPESIPLDHVQRIPQQIRNNHRLRLNGKNEIPFDVEVDIKYFRDQVLPAHTNGMKFISYSNTGEILNQIVYYSIGGGFVITDGENAADDHQTPLEFPIDTAADLKNHCVVNNARICEVVMRNELCLRSAEQIQREILRIWLVMRESIYRGCCTEGRLPGGLNVKRRAAQLAKNLMDAQMPESSEQWVMYLKSLKLNFTRTLKWIGCFAIAVNEENASFGRIVTAPTNGAAGVIPAVLLYYICFTRKDIKQDDIVRFLLVAGEIGSIFKKGSTISAAMGGCQSEIGVSSSMAAAALTEALGGSADQAMMAAEIAMEHHLGLTCDPVGGLVQIPCIERNSMGAIKAITAANIALESDPTHAKVSLDDVVNTMWETARDMSVKYKETSQGGLAVQIPIGIAEC